MTINHAIIIIGLMFGALAAYSIWWLFFSKEAIILKSKQMSAPLQPDESKSKLEQKLEKMKAKQEQLLVETVSDYNEDKLRELNILDHHILVTEERIAGKWTVQPEMKQYSILQ